MNIFFLDNNPGFAARYHCDQHVNKMIVESVQLISTACRKLGNTNQFLYKSINQGKELVDWILTSRSNLGWVLALVISLNNERKVRWGKTIDHKSFEVLKKIYHECKFGEFPVLGETAMPLRIPEQARLACSIEDNGDVIKSYRKYYSFKSEKIKMTWTNVDKPKWMK